MNEGKNTEEILQKWNWIGYVQGKANRVASTLEPSVDETSSIVQVKHKGVRAYLPSMQPCWPKMQNLNTHHRLHNIRRVHDPKVSTMQLCSVITTLENNFSRKECNFCRKNLHSQQSQTTDLSSQTRPFPENSQVPSSVMVRSLCLFLSRVCDVIRISLSALHLIIYERSGSTRCWNPGRGGGRDGGM